jgi:hypothetical protein
MAGRAGEVRYLVDVALGGDPVEHAAGDTDALEERLAGVGHECEPFG